MFRRNETFFSGPWSKARLTGAFYFYIFCGLLGDKRCLLFPLLLSWGNKRVRKAVRASARMTYSRSERCALVCLYQPSLQQPFYSTVALAVSGLLGLTSDRAIPCISPVGN